MITKHFILTNPITRRLYPRVLHFLDGQNIERKLQDLALDDTARFVAANMAHVAVFKSDFALLRYALQQASYRRQLKLYLRLTDVSENRVFRVFPIGPLVSFSQPEAQLDKASYLHVLFQTGARSFLFHVINPEGEVVLRQSYDYTETRPTLRANPEGRIYVGGGARHLTATDIPPSLTSNLAVPPPGPDSPLSTNKAGEVITKKDGKTPKK